MKNQKIQKEGGIDRPMNVYVPGTYVSRVVTMMHQLSSYDNCCRDPSSYHPFDYLLLSESKVREMNVDTTSFNTFLSDSHSVLFRNPLVSAKGVGPCRCEATGLLQCGGG